MVGVRDQVFAAGRQKGKLKRWVKSDHVKPHRKEKIARRTVACPNSTGLSPPNGHL